MCHALIWATLLSKKATLRARKLSYARFAIKLSLTAMYAQREISATCARRATSKLQSMMTMGWSNSSVYRPSAAWPAMEGSATLSPQLQLSRTVKESSVSSSIRRLSLTVATSASPDITNSTMPSKRTNQVPWSSSPTAQSSKEEILPRICSYVPMILNSSKWTQIRICSRGRTCITTSYWVKLPQVRDWMNHSTFCSRPSL